MGSLGEVHPGLEVAQAMFYVGFNKVPGLVLKVWGGYQLMFSPLNPRELAPAECRGVDAPKITLTQ